MTALKIAGAAILMSAAVAMPAFLASAAPAPTRVPGAAVSILHVAKMSACDRQLAACLRSCRKEGDELEICSTACHADHDLCAIGSL